MVIAGSQFSTLIARIVEVIRPDRVVLFGSHARIATLRPAQVFVSHTKDGGWTLSFRAATFFRPGEAGQRGPI